MKHTDDIIESSKLASLMKEKNPKVINATLGVLNDDKGNLLTYKCVSDSINSITNGAYFGYSSVDGGKDYNNLTLNFIFGRHIGLFSKTFGLYALPTPGSTLAIFLSLSMFKKNVKDLILPSHYWAVYDNMIAFFKTKVHKFNYLSNGAFDFNSFSSVVNDLASKKRTICILLNDPANNPTGYSLSKEEWDLVIKLLNSFPNNRFFIILDIAYLDFKEGNYQKNRDFFLPFLNLEKNSLVALCYSGSKTFASYGLRVGSLILFSKNIKATMKYQAESLVFARSIWSTVPSAGLKMFLDLISNSKKIDLYKEELLHARNILSERAKIFIDEAKHCGLEILPYKSGFFVTVVSNTPRKLKDELIKKNIYGVALSNGVRIALSGIPLYEVYDLAQKIKDVIG